MSDVNMKLIIAIINKEDSSMVSAALTREQFSVTKLATTGGFLQAGNVTLLVGTEEDKVDEALGLIRKHSSTRTQVVPQTLSFAADPSGGIPVEVSVGGATIFVVDVDRFEKM